MNLVYLILCSIPPAAKVCAVLLLFWEEHGTWPLILSILAAILIVSSVYGATYFLVQIIHNK